MLSGMAGIAHSHRIPLHIKNSNNFTAGSKSTPDNASYF
jgi:hypothetical protein